MEVAESYDYHYFNSLLLLLPPSNCESVVVADWPNFDCSPQGGQGLSVSQFRVGGMKDASCAHACSEMKKSDSSINGATWSTDVPNCWCQRVMKNVNAKIKNTMSCYLVKKLQGVSKFLIKYFM